MELREYGAVLQRRWRWWATCLVVGVLLATAVAVLSPRMWTAETQVFVSSSQEGTAASQFVQQRVKSYPDVATSAEVLAPVVDSLGLDLSVPALQQMITATNPADTSQITVTVVDADPRRAARIADAVAEEFTSAVERLETTSSGTSPVALTVTNPATVPESPTSPQVSLLVALGLVCGAGVGLAAAVLRDRWDRRVWSVADMRAAWGPGAPEVMPAPTRREPADRAAQVLARRIERRTDSGPIRVLLVSPTPAGAPAAHALVHDLSRVLSLRGIRVAVGVHESEIGATATQPVPRDLVQVDVELVVLSADAALSVWRPEAEDADGVVVVCPIGIADRVDVFELGQLLDAVGAPTVAAVLTARTSRRRALPPRSPEPPASDHQPVVSPVPVAARVTARVPQSKVKAAASRRPSALVENAWAPLTPDGPVPAPVPDWSDELPGNRVPPRVAGARRSSVAAAQRRVQVTSSIPAGGQVPPPWS